MSNRGSLGEYQGNPRDLNINETRNPRHNRGPLRSPVTNPNDPTDDAWMARAWRVAEAMGIVEPNEIQSFLTGAYGVNLVAGTAAAIATFQMPEAEDGFLKEIFVNVTPPDMANIVKWSLLINGGIHPQFNSIIVPSIGIWTGFKVKLNRGQTIVLQAISTGAPAVSGAIRGWGRLIPDTPS